VTRLALFVLALLLAVVGRVSAQTPDFSGQWIAEPAPALAPPTPGKPGPPPRGDMGGGWGSPLTITQDATRLTVEHRYFSNYDIQPPLRNVYALDGSESRNTTMAGHESQTRTSRATWEGPSLVVVTQYPGVDPSTRRPFTTEVTTRVSLRSPTELVVESTRAGVLGAKATTARTVYRKSQ
jgi:hypothetical protein